MTVGAGAVDGLHALGDPHGLLDQGLDDLRLGHGLDDLALDEDLALAVAGGDAEVGLAGLARAVDDAAHDGDAQRDLHALEAGGHLARRACRRRPGRGRRTGRRRSRACAARRFSDCRIWRPTLTSSTGGADSETRIVSPMPLRQQRAERGRRLDRALERRAGLGHAEVQRPVAGLGEQLVGAHHHDRVVVLDRDLEVVEVVLLEQRRPPRRPTRPAPRAWPCRTSPAAAGRASRR